MSWKANIYIKWLMSEIDGWLKDGIIKENQADMIRSRYELEEGHAWGKIIFTSVGSVLFGLGIILFFAYNWQVIPKFVKLALIFLIFLAAHIAAYKFHNSESKHRGLSEGLFVLGTMLFGAGIWLIAQIYHIDEHYPNGLLVWGIGAWILAWSLSSISQCILALTILSFWHFFEVEDFSNVIHTAPLMLLVCSIPVAWIKRSRILFISGLAAAFFSQIVNVIELRSAIFMHIFFAAIILIIISYILDEREAFPEFRSSLYIVGALPYFALLYILTFPYNIRYLIKTRNPDIDVYYSIICIIVLIGLFIYWKINNRNLRFSALLHKDVSLYFFCMLPVLGIFLFSTVIINIFPEFQNYENEKLYYRNLITGWKVAGIFNLIFLIHSIALLREGIKRLSAWRASIGVIFIALIAFSRYVDLFESLIARSAVFLVIGGFIFAIGIFYTKQKQKQEA